MNTKENDITSPYLARQAAMREFMGRAICGDPAEGDVNGLYFLSAPTGSGKNYTAERVAADLVLGGWDRNGRFKKAKGRRNLVFVVPLKANRDEFVANVRSVLLEEGMPWHEVRNLVFGLARTGDSLLDWFEENHDEGYDARRVSCPIVAKEEGANRQIKAAWNDAMEIVAELQAIRRRKGTLGIDLSQGVKGLQDRLGHADLRLRRAVTPVAGDLLSGREAISLIWPAARLLDKTVPHVIALTPQKLLTRIDTVIGGSIVLYDTLKAAESLYIFDEVDHIKGDMLSTIVDQQVAYQPDELLRILDRRFNGGAVDPLLLGDKKQWMALYMDAAAGKNQMGSRATRGGMTKKDALSAADTIAASAARVQKAIASCIEDLGLRHPFVLSREMAGEQFAARRLFGNDDFSISMKRGGSKAICYRLDADRSRNLLGCGETMGPQRLDSALRRVRGVVRMAVGHLARCAYTMDAFYQGSVSYKEDVSRANVLDAFTVRNDETNERAFWDRLMLALFFQNRKNDAIDVADESLYARGVGFTVMETADTHRFTTYVKQHGIERMPEAYLASIAACAPCVCMSATWNAPTVKNFNLSYLDDIHGVVRKDAWTVRLNREIARQTELFNREASAVYEVDCGWVRDAAEISNLASLTGGSYNGSIDSPDEALDAAKGYLMSLGVSDELAVRMIREMVGTVAESATEKAAFELARLGKILDATSKWARGVASGEHYAGAVFTTRHMGNRSEFNALALDLARDMVAEIVFSEQLGHAETRGQARAMAAEAVPCFNAGGWDDGWRAAQTRLESGKPTLMFINLAAGGFSKNLKYRVPLARLDAVRAIDCGYGKAAGRTRADLDFVYVESPVCRLTWNVDGSDDSFGRQALYGVVEQEELAVRGEVPFDEKRRNVRLLLSGVGRLPTRATRSFRCEGARIVSQAIGRMMRTNVKMPKVMLVLDRSIAGDCDFSFLDGMPMGYELQRAVDACKDVSGAYGESDDVVMARRQNLASYRNRAAMERHEQLAWRVLRDDARDDDLVLFDRERDFYLRHFCMPWEGLASIPALRGYMLRMPHDVAGYAYAEVKGKTAPMFEFPRRDDEPVEAAVARLKHRYPQAKVRAVSQESARVPELLEIPAVRGRWQRAGIPTSLCPAADAHMTPYIFQAVYLGGLGESAGRAIFEAYFDGEYTLARADARRAEKAGDYLVLDAQGVETGVWIDFKHYRMNAYERYAEGVFGRSDAERFEAKAAKVGAKLLLVVNVLADDAAMSLGVKALGASDSVLSIPYMAANGAIDMDMMERMRRAIEL